MSRSLKKREINIPKWLWGILAFPAALIAGAAAILLYFFLSFQLDPLNAPTEVIANRLAKMPQDKQRTYIASVLSDTGPHAGDSLQQSNMLSALEYAQAHDLKLSYDMNLVFPYTGDYFMNKYDEPIYETTAPSTAMRILLRSRRPEVVNRAFESAHSSGGDMSLYSCVLDASAPRPDKVYLQAYEKYCGSASAQSETK